MATFKEHASLGLDPLLRHPRQPQRSAHYTRIVYLHYAKTGVIILNLKLIQAPKALIDYVISYEPCHLKGHNHSHAYYHLLDRVLLDWRARRDELNLVKVT